MGTHSIDGYKWVDAENNESHDYLLPALLSELSRLQNKVHSYRAFELGCGNGSVASVLTRQGWDVTGVDPSKEGIAQANQAYPEIKLKEGAAYRRLQSL